MSNALLLCWTACGAFFLTGLITGLWKYIDLSRSENKRAHYYIDISHRASLMYSFACIILAKFVEFSAWSETINFWAALAPIVFFALAVESYIVHGWKKDTTNQLRAPHKMGNMNVHPAWVSRFMWLLAVVEIGGFVVLFAGFLKAQF